MQKSQLDNKTKSKILIISIIAVLMISLPLSFSNFMLGNGFHVSIHITAIILAAFLVVVGFLTYREFRTRRLFLVMCAFFAITIAEIVTLSTFVFSFMEPNTNLDSLITHGLILLMLSFFAVGIFRRD